MAKPLSPERVRELVRMAADLQTEELLILIGAFALDVGCGVVANMVEECPEEYKGQTKVPGKDTWDNSTYVLEDLNESEIEGVLTKYKVFELFDIQLETQKVVAKRQPI